MSFVAQEGTLEDFGTFVTEFLKLFNFDNPSDLYGMGESISIDMVLPDGTQLRGDIPGYQAQFILNVLKLDTEDSVYLSVDTESLGESISLQTGLSMTYDLDHRSGAADLLTEWVRFGELELQGAKLSGVLDESAVNADLVFEGMTGNIAYLQEAGTLSAEAVLKDFDAAPFIGVIGLELPEGFSKEQIPELSGEISLDYQKEDKSYDYTARIETDMISVGEELSFRKTAVKASGNEKGLIVEDLITNLGEMQISFSGNVSDYDFLRPDGEVRVTDLETEEILADVVLKPQEGGVSIAIRSDLLPEGELKTFGSLDTEEIRLDADFIMNGDEIPFLSVIDVRNRVLDLDIEEGSVVVRADLSEKPFQLEGSISEYSLLGVASVNHADFTGKFSDIENWSVNITDALFDGVSYKNEEVTLALDAAVTPDSVVLKDMELLEGGIPLYGSGTVTYATKDILNQPMIFSIELSNNEERYLLEAQYEDEWLSGSVDVIDSSLTRFPIPIGNGYASGYVSVNGNLDDFLISATMAIENGRRLRSSYSGDVEFDVTPERFKINSFTGTMGDVNINDVDLTYDIKAQTIESTADFSLTMDRRPIMGQAVLSSDLSAYTIDLNSMIDVFNHEKMDFDLTFTNMTMDEDTIDDLNTVMTYQEKNLFITDAEPGGFSIDFDAGTGAFKAVMTEKYPISFSMEGTIKEGIVDAVSDDMNLEFSLYQRLGLPFLNFIDGEASGRLNVTGSMGDLEYYGEFFGDSVVVSIEYVPEDIYIDDIYISLIGKEIVFAPFFLRTSSSVGEAAVEMYLEDMLPTSMSALLTIPEDQAIPFDYYFSQLGMTFDGYASGELLLAGDFKELELSGDAMISDGLVSLDLNAEKILPEKPLSRISLDVATGKNVTAVFPSIELPILTATAMEGEILKVSTDLALDQFSAQGDIGIRGGEIIYFQRNFYITEGVINLNMTQDTKDPRVSAIAKLKDFNSAGDKVDIFLTVDNDSVFELSPTFSSNPSMSISEISQILGNNIIPEDFTGTNDLTTALAVATLATDVIQQVGIIDIDPIDDLELSIRNALNLDLFSIRSQVLQNILLDTIPGDFSSTITSNPIARYLDNTTIFLGKYISDDMFLQAIMQLTIDEDTNSGLFITDDIGIDIEISYEWNNPLNTFTLSMAPESFTATDIMDSLSIGMSWNLAF